MVPKLEILYRSRGWITSSSMYVSLAQYN